MKVKSEGTHNLGPDPGFLLKHGENEQVPLSLKDDPQFKFLESVGVVKITDETDDAPAVVALVDVEALKATIAELEGENAELFKLIKGLEETAAEDVAVIAQQTKSIAELEAEKEQATATIAELNAALKKALKK